MTRYLDTCWCDGCGVEITWGPILHHDDYYCCRDCLEGLPCECGRRMELEDERRSRAPEIANQVNITGEL